MPTTKDWLKHSHEELYDQATITYSYLNTYTNRDRMGLGASTMQGQWYDMNFIPSYTNFLILWATFYRWVTFRYLIKRLRRR
jgi:hypothetical protein